MQSRKDMVVDKLDFPVHQVAAVKNSSNIPQTNGDSTDNDHPLQAAEKLRATTTIKAEIDERRMVGGLAQSERYYAELNAAAQVSRLPGSGGSSRLHMDALLGNDESITFDDYLNHGDFVDKW